MPTTKLKGLQIRNLEQRCDKRGSFTEILRSDWKTLVQGEEIKQISLSLSLPNVIRAWHRHIRGQVDYFIVLQGKVRLAIYDNKKLVDITLDGNKLQVVRIPGHYWHGTKNIGGSPSLTLYLFNILYDHDNPDEERLDSIIDPRTNELYNWSEVI